jgi:hypothetical protein
MLMFVGRSASRRIYTRSHMMRMVRSRRSKMMSLMTIHAVKQLTDYCY